MPEYIYHVASSHLLECPLDQLDTTASGLHNDNWLLHTDSYSEFRKCDTVTPARSTPAPSHRMPRCEVSAGRAAYEHIQITEVICRQTQARGHSLCW